VTVTHRARRRREVRRRRIALPVLAFLTLGSAGFAALAQTGPAQPDFTDTKTVTRTHLEAGKDVVADRRTVTVSADRTHNLRDGEVVNLSWTGAHPTFGRVRDSNASVSANVDYPVVILECRGVDSTSVPVAQQLSAETCYTQTPDLRRMYPADDDFPPYRLDRYATPAERTEWSGRPADTKCDGGYDGWAEHWVPFIAASGHVYQGGDRNCADLAPDQSPTYNAQQPPTNTFAASDSSGAGSTRFIVQTSDSNASLGCDRSVSCAIVVIPIEGISCDPSAASLPAADQPSDPTSAGAECEKNGYLAQTNDPPPSVDSTNLAATGKLWWSASNWRNRITIPIDFAVSSSVCSQAGASVDIYGSEYLLQAAQQWQPKLCLDPKLQNFQYVETGEVEAKNLLATSGFDGYAGVKAAFQAGPPASAFTSPIVQAPTAVTAFTIVYWMDRYDGHGNYYQYTNLKLTPRLLAKLLTASYPAAASLREKWANDPKYKNFLAQSHNPYDMSTDPEFLALNPQMVGAQPASISPATLAIMSADSDVMTALTSYINADPDARDWLNGVPDPWGMVVNPYYKKIPLPVSSWPLQDPTTFDDTTACYSFDPTTPWQSLVNVPVALDSQLTYNMVYDIATSQTGCNYEFGQSPDLTRRLAIGRQVPQNRFLMGVVSLADAQRYQLLAAQLLTQTSSNADPFMADVSGYKFVGPTDEAVKAAAHMMVPDDTVGTWTMPYDKLRSDPAGAAAYPGTLIVSTDVPTKGLQASDAKAFASILGYIGGPGQSSGTAPGTLPAGYIPLTSANGLSAMANYTAKAASAVIAQEGLVPFVSGKAQPASTPTSSPTPTPTREGVPVVAQSSQASSSPASDNSRSESTATTTRHQSSNALRSMTPTQSIHPVSVVTSASAVGPAALLLPLLVAIGLAAAFGSFWLSGVGRR